MFKRCLTHFAAKDEVFIRSSKRYKLKRRTVYTQAIDAIFLNEVLDP